MINSMSAGKLCFNLYTQLCLINFIKCVHFVDSAASSSYLVNLRAFSIINKAPTISISRKFDEFLKFCESELNDEQFSVKVKLPDSTSLTINKLDASTHYSVFLKALLVFS
jgi:hypothetical protein